MQLSAQESSAAFWSGAKHGALRSLGYVAAAGIVLAIGMATFIPAGTISISAAILTGISTVFTVGMFSGHNALAQYHQSKHNQLYDSRITRLEGQTPGLNHEVEVVHSPRISTILQEGARSGSFADSEQERATAPKNHTIH